MSRTWSAYSVASVVSEAHQTFCCQVKSKKPPVLVLCGKLKPHSLMYNQDIGSKQALLLSLVHFYHKMLGYIKCVRV